MKSAYVPPHRRPKQYHKRVDEKYRPAAPKQDFDAETGLVFHETEVVFRKKYHSDWIGELKAPSIVKRLGASPSGSRSLLDIARTKCVAEIRSFTPRHFDSVPWSIAATIWAEIVSTHSESFHAWRTMASVYDHPDEFGRPENRYHMIIKQPPLPTQEYFRGISGTEGRWLSALRISPKQLSLPELVSIASIRNLTVLDLSDGQILLDKTTSPFEERIVRTWAEMALSGKAFGQLRVLMLGWQDNASAWIFKYLDRFPLLHYIITTDCKNLHQRNRIDWEETATAHGWIAHHAKRSVKLLRPLLDDGAFHTAAVSNLYYHSLENVSGVESDGASPYSRRPVLESWLGTPRSWNHILDDFPGTRTVWFEKAEPKSARKVQDPELLKRSRETTQTLQSPPRKKSQGGRMPRSTAATKSVADLLKEMGA